MRRILLVDDEADILEGLRHRLHRQRSKWQMHFVLSGQDALSLLAREPIDVIVTDMRMPVMDGAALLRAVQEQYPHIVRVVLSGQSELEMILRTVPVAHQFLAKPCEVGALEQVIERACSLQTLIGDRSVQRVVGRIDRLPSEPRIYNQLAAVLAGEHVTVHEVAEILQQDTAMCAKTLQLVNSAFFRLPRTISTIEEAVSYLGFNTLRQVALAAEVFQIIHEHEHASLALAALQAHSLQVGRLSAQLFTDKYQQENALVAGLLHDIGMLVLAVGLPKHFAGVRSLMAAQGCSMYAAERRLGEATHAELGGYLLGLWGLPLPIVEAVANHHQPSRVASQGLDLLVATHIADALVHEAQNTERRPDAQCERRLDIDWIESLGLGPQLPAWRALARERIEAPV